MNERVNALLHNRAATHTGVGVLALGGGLIIGYQIASYRWRKVTEELRTEIYEHEEAMEAATETIEEATTLIDGFEATDLTIDPVTGETMLRGQITSVRKIEDIRPEEVDPSGPTEATQEAIDLLDLNVPDDFLPRGEPQLISVDQAAKAKIDEMVKAGIPREIAQATVIEAAQNIEEDESEDEPDEPEADRVNIFESESPGVWNQEEEDRKRERLEGPYILHRDEFFSSDTGLPQVALTWFSGDSILVDPDMQPVYNFTEVVGDLRFGHGSMDDDILYVRNTKIGAEYEIVRETGHYSVEVLGNDDSEAELQHSHAGRKRRLDD